MKYILFILFSLSTISSHAFANRPGLHWLEGRWAGTGGDVNSTFNWTITLSYKAESKTIQLTYPSHNCGGSLQIITIETGKATCMEDVNYGLDQCNSGLKVYIKQESDGSISLSYYYVGNPSMKSAARLKRIA
jgi:hypothetical protein